MKSRSSANTRQELIGGFMPSRSAAINISIGILAIISTFIGANVAANHALRKPENQERLARARLVMIAAQRATDSVARAKKLDDYRADIRGRAMLIAFQADSARRADSAKKAANAPPPPPPIPIPSKDERALLNLLCATDWSYAKTNDDRAAVIGGHGPLMAPEYGACSMNRFGRVIWARYEKTWR